MSKIQQTQQTHAQTAAKANKPQQVQHKSFNPAQLFESPESMRSEDVLAAQQTVGNQVVQRALDKDDRRKGLTDNQGNLRQDLNEQIQQKRGGGSPLPENIQKEASKKLGRNFKDVRIHTDESADKLSRTISARAFTIGKDIFFKNGVFAPGSGAGRETIMHELTHVVQQGGKSGASGALKLGAPDTAHEKEADRIGKKHAASVGAAPAGAVQREGEEDELMMQSAPEEEELLQMQGEEDELQMQEDEEELQMQEAEEEEEELQMQPAEEDELQMQPDSGNTIQRKWELGEDGQWKKASEQQDESRPAGFIDTRKKIKKAMGSSPLPGTNQTQLNKSNLNKELLEKVGGKEKQITGKSMGGVFHAEARRKEKFDENVAAPYKAEKDKEKQDAKDKDISDTKEKWMATLKDPKASKAEIEAAEEKLKTLHEGAFSKEQLAEAKAARKAAMKEAAMRGDEDAYKNMKTESAAESAAQAAEEAKKKKNSKGAKAKGFFKSVGSGLLSAGKSVGGFLKRRLGALDEHVFGKEEEKEEKDAKAGGGAGGTSEMIAELYQENKKLKAQITELEKAKV